MNAVNCNYNMYELCLNYLKCIIGEIVSMGFECKFLNDRVIRIKAGVVSVNWIDVDILKFFIYCEKMQLLKEFSLP